MTNKQHNCSNVYTFQEILNKKWNNQWVSNGGETKQLKYLKDHIDWMFWKKPYMAHPSLHLLPGNQHSSPPRGTSGHTVSDHITFQLQAENSSCGLRKSEHAESSASSKHSFIRREQVEGNTVPNDDIHSDGRSQHPFYISTVHTSHHLNKHTK